ncbi:MAG TPA: hypothetical protein VIU65_03605, partial [Pyrinomonadaceae bacterium]
MTFKQIPRQPFCQLTFLGFLIFVVSALAQGEKPVPAETLARINVTVTDRADRAVEDVRKDDLQVTEDGAPQTIAYFERDERPITCG